ncbi:unnamed protein product, partial [Ostreobium quekettii]
GGAHATFVEPAGSHARGAYLIGLKVDCYYEGRVSVVLASPDASSPKLELEKLPCTPVQTTGIHTLLEQHSYERPEPYHSAHGAAHYHESPVPHSRGSGGHHDDGHQPYRHRSLLSNDADEEDKGEVDLEEAFSHLLPKPNLGVGAEMASV